MNTEKENTLTDEQILEIMHEHGLYRRLKADADKELAQWDLTSLPSREQVEAMPRSRDKRQLLKILTLYEKYGAESLMTDKAFLRQLHDIVPAGVPVVGSQMAAEIYNLRARYEYLPTVNGKRPHYTRLTVRHQVRANKNHPEHGIRPLSDEEQQEILGSVQPRTHFFYLEDVLRHELGRWPSSKRTSLPKLVSERKSGRGRESVAHLLADKFVTAQV